MFVDSERFLFCFQTTSVAHTLWSGPHSGRASCVALGRWRRDLGWEALGMSTCTSTLYVLVSVLYTNENITSRLTSVFGLVLFPVFVWSRSRLRRLLWNFAAWSWTPTTKTAGAERSRSWRSEHKWSTCVHKVPRYCRFSSCYAVAVCLTLFLLKVEPCECCSGQRSSRRV